jgi:hypothetical protein
MVFPYPGRLLVCFYDVATEISRCLGLDTSVKVSKRRPSRLTDSSLCQADMNLDVIRTLVVDENLVLCSVLLAFHRAVVRRERER